MICFRSLVQIEKYVRFARVVHTLSTQSMYVYVTSDLLDDSKIHEIQFLLIFSSHRWIRYSINFDCFQEKSNICS